MNVLCSSGFSLQDKKLTWTRYKALVAELAYAGDLKSPVLGHVGSSPTEGTISFF